MDVSNIKYLAARITNSVLDSVIAPFLKHASKRAFAASLLSLLCFAAMFVAARIFYLYLGYSGYSEMQALGIILAILILIIAIISLIFFRHSEEEIKYHTYTSRPEDKIPTLEELVAEFIKGFNSKD